MSHVQRSKRSLSCVVSLAGIVIAALVLSAAPANARGNKVTPGNFTGYGFDQCVAPTQQAMNRWLTTSPYWAVGIYIAGDSRACPQQPNLTRRWVSTQLRNGWRLLPLTVGPQAACSTRYKYKDDVKIVARPERNYEAARKQGRHEAAKTVRAASALGITRKSTLWYDIEAFSITGTRCRESAISFLSGWTRKLHSLHYMSGVYSSASSGIKMLDDIFDAPGRYAMPDRIWIADWNGKADIHSSYVRSHTWMPHKRIHQYLGGHPETYGGVTINVDSNFMSLGRGSIAPTTRPACGVGISRIDYHVLEPGDRTDEVKALHCLLKRKGGYDGGMHRKFNAKTRTAVVAFQRTHGLRASGVVTIRTWTAMHAAGAEPVLKYGSAGTAVRRVQRALNAAVDARLAATGVYTGPTAKALRRYQRAAGLAGNGVVASSTWAQLQAGQMPQQRG